MQDKNWKKWSFDKVNKFFKGRWFSTAYSLEISNSEKINNETDFTADYCPAFARRLLIISRRGQYS